jgi:hypothetical protein
MHGGKPHGGKLQGGKYRADAEGHWRQLNYRRCMKVIGAN